VLENAHVRRRQPGSCQGSIAPREEGQSEAHDGRRR
jgi:hypothetical protein